MPHRRVPPPRFIPEVPDLDLSANDIDIKDILAVLVVILVLGSLAEVFG